MTDEKICSVCNAVMPAASSAIGKAVGTAVFGTLGLRKSDPVQLVVMGLLGLGLGHLADLLVVEIAKPVCGRCRAHTQLG